MPERIHRLVADEAAHPRGPAPAPAPAPRTGAAETLLRLQRTAGNQAVRDLVGIQRDAATSTLAAGGDVTSAPAEPAAGALSSDQRIELRRLTGNRITRAFTAFALAVEQNRAAVKAAAADSSDFATLLLEIVLGRLLPGISKGISNLAQELPQAASTIRYRLAIAALNEERTTALLETGVKWGTEYLKGETTALAGEDEIDLFLNTLQDHFNKGADAIDRNLPNISDEALGVVCAAYDPSVAGIPQFRAAVEGLLARYKKQVMPIGTTEYHWMNEQSNFSLYWVVSPSGTKRLALLENQDLKEWISKELQTIAINKFVASPAGRAHNGAVPEIPASRVGRLAG